MAGAQTWRVSHSDVVDSRHEWSYFRPGTDYQLTIAATTRFVPSMSLTCPSPIDCCRSCVDVAYHFKLCDSADLFSVTVLETG